MTKSQINPKLLIKIINKVGADKDDIIKITKRKRKRRNKKIKPSSEPLQNNKPNFTSQNQIGVGAGGIGGTAFNPFYQRSSPPVTTVVNTPPNNKQQNNGQNEITRFLLEDKKNNDKFNELTKSQLALTNYVKNEFDNLNYGAYYLNGGIDMLDNKINKLIGSKPIITEIMDAASDNIGFKTSSQKNPLSNPTNYKNQYVVDSFYSDPTPNRGLSNQITGSFRNVPQNNLSDPNDRFGIVPINGNPTAPVISDVENAYHDSDNGVNGNSMSLTESGDDTIQGPIKDNKEQLNDFQKKLLNQSNLSIGEVLAITENPKLTYTENDSDNEYGSDYYKALEPLPSLDIQNINTDRAFETIDKLTKKAGIEGVVTHSDVKNAKNTVETFKKNNENNAIIDDSKDEYDSESWKERDRINAQLAREEKAKKEAELLAQQEQKAREYAEKREQGINQRGKPPKGWEKFAKTNNNLTSEAIESKPKFTNDNSKLTQQNEVDNDTQNVSRRSKRIERNENLELFAMFPIMKFKY